MKTTLELPDDLVREIKLRAVNDGSKLKDTMADLLRKGLSSGKGGSPSRSSRVKVPLIKCQHAADLGPDQVADILLKQEVAWHHEAS